MRMIALLITLIAVSFPASGAVYGQWNVRVYVPTYVQYVGWSEETLLEFTSEGRYENGRIILQDSAEHRSYDAYPDYRASAGGSGASGYLRRLQTLSVAGWFSRDKKNMEIDHIYTDDYWLPYEYEDGVKRLWSLRGGDATKYTDYSWDGTYSDQFAWDSAPSEAFSNVRYDIERLSVVPLPGALWMMSSVALAGGAVAAARSRRARSGPARWSAMVAAAGRP